MLLCTNFLFCFYSFFFIFLLSNNSSINIKAILSLKRKKDHPRPKEGFSNKAKSHHFDFTFSFIICKFILVYFLLAHKSKQKQGIHISSLREYKFNSLEFLKFQNESKSYLYVFQIRKTYFFIRFMPCQKMK